MIIAENKPQLENMAKSTQGLHVNAGSHVAINNS